MTRARLTIIILLLCLLPGCGADAETAAAPAGTPLEIAAEIIHSQPDLPALEFLSPDSEPFASYLTQIYGIPEDGFTDGAIGYAGGIEASEIAVLIFSDEDAAQSAVDVLLDYIAVRADSFTGYVPEQAALAEGGTAVRQGRCAALLICADTGAAQEAFHSCFEPGWEPPDQPVYPASPELPQAPAAGAADTAPERTETESVPEPEDKQPEPQAEAPAQAGEDAGEEPSAVSGAEPLAPEPPAPPPGTASAGSEFPDPAPAETAPTDTVEASEDRYDHDAVTAAWQSGDPSGLSEKNQAVYEAAETVIAQVIAGGMTPYRQELAIHDYLTAHARYDSDAHSNAPNAAPDPDNDNPYGMLVNGVGICYGYASTFQLFMDLLEIECITVSGRSAASQEHAWNMVRLDGEWYCVDVTWDDPSGGSPGHRYFNVTSQFMRQTNHYWNQTNVPEATAARWAYQS